MAQEHGFPRLLVIASCFLISCYSKSLSPWKGCFYTPKEGPNEVLFDFKYKLDPTTKPKEIDFIPEVGPAKGRTLHGIYSLERDELKICYVSPNTPEPEKKNRPAESSAKKGSGCVLLVFQRDVLDETVLDKAGFDKEELEFARRVLAAMRESGMPSSKEAKEFWAKPMDKVVRLWYA